MSVNEHKKASPSSVRFRVITVSDTRNEDTDKSGRLMMDLLTDAGHIAAGYEIVKDERTEIETALRKALQDPGTDAVLTNGGTGLAIRDVTIETVTPFFDKEISGFGELFRMLSYQEDIGSAAILSRAAAGTAGSKVIFSVPGSSGAVKLAMKKLILPEAGHIISELNK